MEKKKVVLAYSGGLDTSVAIKWLQEKNYDVIALCLDLGEGKDLAFVKEKIREWGNYDCPKDNLATKRLFLHIAFCLGRIITC